MRAHIPVSLPVRPSLALLAALALPVVGPAPARAAGPATPSVPRHVIDVVREFRPDIVLSYLVMPRLDGLGLLRALQQAGEEVTTVILTAQGTVDTAVEALKHGAYDYLSKPVDLQRLRILLDKIIERQATLSEVKALRRQLRENVSFGSMIGGSAPMREVYRLVEQAEPTSASVLITGESGTGKELVAQTIHQLSPRNDLPFVGLNCAAIPETLLESEIFGHEKGAFTGAMDRRAGCFELADRGTLFLDEIAEMAPGTQVKLLRVLQVRRFRRLGGRVEQEGLLTQSGEMTADELLEQVRDHRWHHRATVETVTAAACADGSVVSVPTFVNEFWTSRHRAAHSLHEISYRACFKPQLPRFFVDRLTAPGAIVYDPFAGSGTTLAVATGCGRDAIGADLDERNADLAAERCGMFLTVEHLERAA